MRLAALLALAAFLAGACARADDASPVALAQIAIPGVPGVALPWGFHFPGPGAAGPSYTAPTYSPLIGLAGDSFTSAAGGQSYTASGTWSDVAGGGPVYGSELFGRSGMRVMPGVNSVFGISGSSPAAMAMRAASTRIDNGVFTGTASVTSNAACSGGATGAALSVAVNNTGTAAIGGRTLDPGTVFTLAGQSGVATVTSELAADLGAAEPWIYCIANPSALTGTSVTITAVPNPAGAITGIDTSAAPFDEQFEASVWAGGEANQTALGGPNLFNIENAHNGDTLVDIANACVLDTLDEYIRAMGPNGATLGPDSTHTSALCAWGGGWAGVTPITVPGDNAALLFDDNYMGGEQYFVQVHTLASTSWNPTNNFGIAYAQDSKAPSIWYMTQSFSDACAGYPTGVAPASLSLGAAYSGGVWTGKTYNAVPVVFFGGSGSQAPVIGTRVASAPAANQYTLTITSTSATYGFNAADVSAAKVALTSYCFVDSAHPMINGNDLQAYSDFQQYYDSTSASFTSVAPGTGTAYGLPGASSYPQVSTVPTFVGTLDPDGLAQGVYWPKPTLTSTSGSGNHVSPTGAVLIGQLVGGKIATLMSAYAQAWSPTLEANSYQLMQNGTGPLATWSTTIPQQYLAGLSTAADGYEFCTSDSAPVCAVSPGGSGALSLTCVAPCTAATFNSASGALSITYSSARASNTKLFLWTGYPLTAAGARNPITATAPGANILNNPQLGYEVCGKGDAINYCGGSASAGQQAAGVIQSATGATGGVGGLQCGDNTDNAGDHGSGFGTASSNFVPQGWLFTLNATEGAALAASTLDLTCGWGVPPGATDGKLRFYVQAEGYLPSASYSLKLSQNFAVTTPYIVETGAVATTDKIRAYARLIVVPGNLGHLVGVTPLSVVAGMSVTASTVNGQPCNQASVATTAAGGAGSGCTSIQASCIGATGGEIYTDLALIDGGGSYYQEDCLTPPMTTSSDGYSGTTGSLAINLPGAAVTGGWPLSVRVYVVTTDVHVSAN